MPFLSNDQCGKETLEWVESEMARRGQQEFEDACHEILLLLKKIHDRQEYHSIHTHSSKTIGDFIYQCPGGQACVCGYNNYREFFESLAQVVINRMSHNTFIRHHEADMWMSDLIKLCMPQYNRRRE